MYYNPFCRSNNLYQYLCNTESHCKKERKKSKQGKVGMRQKIPPPRTGACLMSVGAMLMVIEGTKSMRAIIQDAEEESENTAALCGHNTSKGAH